MCELVYARVLDFHLWFEKMMTLFGIHIRWRHRHIGDCDCVTSQQQLTEQLNDDISIRMKYRISYYKSVIIS